MNTLFTAVMAVFLCLGLTGCAGTMRAVELEYQAPGTPINCMAAETDIADLQAYITNWQALKVGKGALIMAGAALASTGVGIPTAIATAGTIAGSVSYPLDDAVARVAEIRQECGL